MIMKDVFFMQPPTVASRSPPKKFHPIEYHRLNSQSADKFIFSEQQILDSKLRQEE